MRYWEVSVRGDQGSIRWGDSEVITWGDCEVITYNSRHLGSHVALVSCSEHAADLLRGCPGVERVIPAEDGTYADDRGEQYQLSGNGTVLTPVSALLAEDDAAE
jgi:hypothetical protein